ncbi:MAG: enoyl-CoA hydratase/isomerase family protein [Gemmatimonadaceae bacterium]
MPPSDLLYEGHDGVARITFNRPDALNALRQQTIAALLDALRQVEDDASVRALVLTGAGRAFSAGRDLKDEDALTATPPLADDVATVVEQYQELTRCLTRMDKIVISAINGVAVGIGAELAAASDVRLASTQARIAFPEVRRALFLTNGVLHRLPRIVGLGRATEWILSGRMVEADEMLASGFVSRLVDDAALVDDALQTAAQMALNAPVPLRLAKELLNRAYEVDLESMLGLERDALVRCVQTDDYREGVRAFLEKRAPRFTGT